MQPNDVGTQRDLVLYRIETAKEDLKSAKILRDAGYVKGSLPDKVVGFFCWFNGREWTILDKLAKNVLTFCGTKSIINL